MAFGLGPGFYHRPASSVLLLDDVVLGATGSAVQTLRQFGSQCMDWLHRRGQESRNPKLS